MTAPEAGAPHPARAERRPGCPSCGGARLYRCPDVSSGTLRGPNLLPALGGFLQHARFEVVVCEDCGLVRFFADRRARARLADSTWWHPV